MKRTIKRTLSVLLIAVLLLTTAPLTGLDDLFASKASAAYAVGDHIEYGNYPQSKVTDESTLALLESKSKNWISYRYYSGSGSWYDGKMEPSDYMFYADIDVDGDGLRDYRAVRIDKYRPYCTGYTFSNSKSCQDGNGYTTGKIYYFKFEPIEWRILDPIDGLIMTEKIIDSQAYNSFLLLSGTVPEDGDDAYWGDADKTYYANDYYNSSIRQWLNNDFYNTAFTSSQANNIRKDVTLNNDCYSSSYPQYNSQASNDKIFLLSYEEARTSAYGFNSSALNDDPSRDTMGTDYANSQGLLVYCNNSQWWLRSPNSRSNVVFVIYSGGFVNDKGLTDTGVGVRPACRLSNLRSDVSKSAIGNNTSTTKLHVGKYLDLSGKETDEAGTWSSSDESVATVSQDGIVHAIKKGTTSIIRKAARASETAKVNLSVCDDSDCTWKITKIGSEYTAGARDYVCGICGEVVKSEEFKDNLRITINSSNLSYVKGDKIIMAVSDFVFTKEYKPGKLSLTISDDSILDVTDIKDFSEMTNMKIKMFENCRIVILEAKGVGSAWISLTNEQTGHTRKIPIVVSQDKYETIRADKIQTYEYKAWLEKDKYNAAFDGIWVSDFSCNEVSDGWNFSMNIYNENYSNAVLEVFDKDGKLIKVQIIDKFESLTKGVVDTAVAGYTVVKDAIDGDSLSFRADTISKLTSVKNLKVPQDGFIRITADSSVSANCAIVNAFDIAFTCWTFASDISEFITGIEKFDRDSADKLTKAALFKLMAQEEYLNFAKKFQDKFIGSLGTDLSLDMLVNLSNKILTDANVLLFRGLDVSFNDIVNMALGTGAGVAEGLFLKLSGPYGAILKGMFMVQDISDWTLEVNNVAKRISGRTPFGCMTPYKGTSSALVLKNDDVTVNTNGNVPNEAVMQSFRIAKGNEYVRELMKAINKPIEEYETYEIALYNDGSIVQPNGKVEVYIVSPYKSVTVYRQNADGSWEPIESRIKNGMVIFEVDHFCKFVIAEEAEPEKPSNPSSTCSHICHKGGISAFFYKIARFFWKLFKIKKFCTCGVAHY